MGVLENVVTMRCESWSTRSPADVCSDSLKRYGGRRLICSFGSLKKACSKSSAPSCRNKKRVPACCMVGKFIVLWVHIAEHTYSVRLSTVSSGFFALSRMLLTLVSTMLASSIVVHKTKLVLDSKLKCFHNRGFSSIIMLLRGRIGIWDGLDHETLSSSLCLCHYTHSGFLSPTNSGQEEDKIWKYYKVVIVCNRSLRYDMKIHNHKIWKWVLSPKTLRDGSVFV
jgi:hypothetical protein